VSRANPGDKPGQERTHRERLRGGDYEDYANELRHRVDNGDHHPDTTRRYIETLHRVHPRVVDLFDRWAHHDDAEWKNQEAIDHKHPDSKKLELERREHRRVAASARRNGDIEANHTGHRAVFFLKPPTRSRPKRDGSDGSSDEERNEHEELLKNHLYRIHSSLVPGGRQIAMSSSTDVSHEHRHADHPSPDEARETAHLHTTVLKHHFPNVRTHIDDRLQANIGGELVDRTNVDISNLHLLKPRPAST